MTKRIVVHSWGPDDGPVYDIETRRGGFSNRRRRFVAETYGKRQRAALREPAHHVVQVAGSDYAVLFNKGFVYYASVLVDAEHDETVFVDASEGFHVFTLPDGVDLLGVEVSSGDDEERPGGVVEVASDEEE